MDKAEFQKKYNQLLEAFGKDKGLVLGFATIVYSSKDKELEVDIISHVANKNTKDAWVSTVANTLRDNVLEKCREFQK